MDPSPWVGASGTVGRGQHLLPTVLLVLPLLVTAAIGHGDFVIAVAIIEVGTDLAFATELGEDSLFACDILGGNVEKL